MNAAQNRTRWLGSALACGLTALAVAAHAKKPVEPQPEPPPVTFTVVNAGYAGDGDDWLWADAINDNGAIVGTITFRDDGPEPGTIYHYGDAAFLLEPVEGSYFQDEDEDGVNDLIQFLPSSTDAWGRDINNLGQIIGNHARASVGVVWDGGEVVYEMPESEFVAINNAGAVVGMFWRLQSEGFYKSITFIIDPVDTDQDGRPDTWYKDEDGDETNDCLYVVHDVDFGAEPLDILDDMTVICRDFVFYDAEADDFVFNRFPSVVRPDFSDADGDGNPWYADTDGDGVNDLFENFPVNGTIASASTGGLAVGNYDRDAALFDVTALTYTDLNWVDPNAKPSGGRGEAVAVNDAAWIIGNVYDRKGNGWPVFWQDGTLWKFGEIAPTSFRLKDINQSGVIAGERNATEIFVAFPSVSPE